MSEDKEIGARLALARRAAGYSTASEAAAALDIPYPTYAGHENGSRGLKRNLERYGRRFGVSADWLLTGRGSGPRPRNGIKVVSTPLGKVRLMGRVGAGQVVVPFEEDLDEWADEPADAKPGTEAVEVAGDSMFPAYEDGTLLYYSRQLPAYEMVNKRAIVRLADGSMLVKVIRAGSQPDLWTLQSINSLYPDMTDRVVDWAAPIDWTKPR